MRIQRIASLVLLIVLIAQSLVVFAFETDQYNLPPEPLADVGDEVNNYVEQSLSKAIYKLNSEILIRQQCLQETVEVQRIGKCESVEKEKAKLEYLRSEDAVVREIYNLLGTGMVPFTKSGTWMESHRFNSAPARYKTGFFKSIYISFPTDYIGIASTVNVYGSQFGTDKIAHLFQQGYDYLKVYKEEIARGGTSDAATKKAVEWGQKTERGIFGTLISGVYSNADLFSNYVGMKFYLGLTREIKIGNSIRPPILLLKDGIWAFNENIDLRKQLLKPFISDHLNEALNPSIYTKHLGLRAVVRRIVKKRSCAQWLERYPNLSQADFNEISNSLVTWNGEDYGFTGSENFITIANTCFDNDPSTVIQSDLNQNRLR